MNNINKYKNLAGGLLFKDNPKTWEYNAVCKLNTNSKLPATFMLEGAKIKNQQSKSTCAAHALASAMEIMDYYDTKSTKEYSTSWYYGYRKTTDHQGDGMYLPELLDNARTVGGVYKSLMPDNLDYEESKNMIDNMTEVCLQEASKHRLKNYASISNIADIPNAIYQNKAPVIIGMLVFESFLNTGDDGIVKEPDILNERCYGGHAVLCVGWTTINSDTYLVIQNSWGESWGANGYCYVKIDGVIPFREKFILFDVTDYPIEYKDINNHWGKDNIQKASRFGLMNGYEDGTFKPDQPITRAELATVLVKLMNK